ncbi:hypothetical protein H8356DRAFT_1669691 [Neocallimastix lanati (nom. inval.)]|uniref:Uncharacterized protein n=1 Tax=Neocallimastix californiae TaxID=1754190 RepID=A0A1Y2EW60_9FUNG|nr:hypothetical protein H8356DRAFT_1669691 [Neocallimastix sp. JGI-2020a]ORY75841.1 hypothetical protein LY90DRAFT_125756 [Neocallimastix californiae]|eukprot:ORY75841.1 hypothetical protein LY90DRAFT_125756 [Neocallimastix californiae]
MIVNFKLYFLSSTILIIILIFYYLHYFTLYEFLPLEYFQLKFYSIIILNVLTIIMDYELNSILFKLSLLASAITEVYSTNFLHDVHS